MAHILVADRFIKSATVKTCAGGFYRDLRKLRPSLYRYAPDDGLTMKVDYADFSPSRKPDKTIVAVHGTPGNFHCFKPIGEHFLPKNVRLVALNLPDFGHTRQNRSFYHSTAERLQFLKDFLRLIQVTEIDCLCSHSFGAHSISALWDNPEEIKIKSVVLFAPQPLWDPSIKSNNKLIRRLFFKSELWYNFLDRFEFYKNTKFPMKFENVNEFLLTCCLAYDEESPSDLPRRLNVLADRLSIPFVVMYGTKEGIIRKFAVQRIIESLRIPETAQFELNPQTDSPESLQMSSPRMFYNIQGGKHFVHTTHWPYTVRIIENLLTFDNTKIH